MIQFDRLYENMRFLSRFWTGVGILVFLHGCGTGWIKVEGEFADLQGEVRLLTVMPSLADTLSVAGQVQGKRVEWKIPALNIPAKVWIEAEGKRVAEFILDRKEGMRLEGSLKNDSVVVSGGRLEEEYVALRQFLKENYQMPLEEIDWSISKMIGRSKRTNSDEKRLTRLITLKGHYERYREAYIKKLIRANLSHELSLVLIEEELRDSVQVQRQLFYELNIENKNSNLYKVLENKLQ